MNAYVDTSALVPLLIDEATSESAGRLWDRARRRASVLIVYTEARAALAQAARTGRIDRDALTRGVDLLERLYGRLHVLGVDRALARRAGVLAEEHALRGYDALHLAGAERIADDQLVLISADQQLCSAATRLGLTAINPATP